MERCRCIRGVVIDSPCLPVDLKTSCHDVPPSFSFWFELVASCKDRDHVRSDGVMTGGLNSGAGRVELALEAR